MLKASSTGITIATLSIFLAGLLIYLPGLNGPLFFDDKPALTANAQVKIDGTVMDEWRQAAFSSNSGRLRRPLAMMSFAANHAAIGHFSPPGLKAVNLAIHLSIAGLLYLLFHSVLNVAQVAPDHLTRKVVALTATAIWLLHPLNVSTVLYTVQRMAQLAALFTLVGLVVFMRHRERWAQQGAAPGEILAAALWLLLLTAVAALSKENGVLLPWLVLVFEVCLFRGIWAGRPSYKLRRIGWIALVLPLVLVLGILVVSPGSLIGGYAGREFTLEERLLTQPRLLWRYLGWIVFPNINDMGFHHDDIPLSTGLLTPVTTVLSLGGWLVLLLVSFLLRQRYPLLLLAVLFFLVGQSMESSVIALEMVYEHRNYLPATLVCLGIAVLLVIPAARSSRIGVWYPVGGALAILCLLLFVRVQTWSDELTLSRVNLAYHPESSRSNHFYANALLRQLQDARQHSLSQREKDESLLLSRHYFERMHQTNKRDVVALVMLSYLDSHYFTQLQSQIDWQAPLEELLATKILQPSDWNALDLYFDLAASNANMASEEQVSQLLDKLTVRYPNSAEILRYRYRYLSAGKSEPARLLPLLQQARELAPGSTWVYEALLSENARNQDVAGMYEYARLWLLHDSQRYGLRQIKSLFAAVEPESQASDD